MKRKNGLLLAAFIELLVILKIVSLFHSMIPNIVFGGIIIILGIVEYVRQKNKKKKELEQKHQLLHDYKVIVAMPIQNGVWISSSRTEYYINLECVYFDETTGSSYQFKGKKCFMGRDSDYGFKYKSLLAPDYLNLLLESQNSICIEVKVMVEKNNYSNYIIDFTSFLDDLLNKKIYK